MPTDSSGLIQADAQASSPLGVLSRELDRVQMTTRAEKPQREALTASQPMQEQALKAQQRR